MHILQIERELYIQPNIKKPYKPLIEVHTQKYSYN